MDRACPGKLSKEDGDTALAAPASTLDQPPSALHRADPALLVTHKVPAEAQAQHRGIPESCTCPQHPPQMLRWPLGRVLALRQRGSVPSPASPSLARTGHLMTEWACAHLVTDELPLLLVVILAQQLDLVRGQVHAVLGRKTTR